MIPHHPAPGFLPYGANTARPSKNSAKIREGCNSTAKSFCNAYRYVSAYLYQHIQ